MQKNKRSSLLLDDPIPPMTMAEEKIFLARRTANNAKDEFVEWIFAMRDWNTRADLTFRNNVGEDVAQRAFRRWVARYAPAAWVVVGLERQERGSVHIHAVFDRDLPEGVARQAWVKDYGWAFVSRIRDGKAAVAYAIKHAVKDGNVEIWGPGAPGGLFTTGAQSAMILSTPTGATGRKEKRK